MRWDFPAHGEPYDAHVGPFPHRPFVEAWATTVGRGEAISLSSGGAFLPMVAEGGTVTIAGDAELTDYHSPLGGDPSSLAPPLIELAKEHSGVSLDSLPEGSAMRIAGALAEFGVDASAVQHEAAAVITVEDDYLGGLTKKQRHEARRKRRRLTEELGIPELVVTSGAPDPMDRFVEMHRRSLGEKGTFLTEPREEFFRSLHRTEGWVVAELVAGGRVVASLFGFRRPDTFYLYNSAYDLESREASPGVVALHLLIESLVEAGCRRIDLLKGDEIYKFRMGAVKRPLYEISL